jgi:hypothetical protein
MNSVEEIADVPAAPRQRREQGVTGNCGMHGKSQQDSANTDSEISCTLRPQMLQERNAHLSVLFHPLENPSMSIMVSATWMRQWACRPHAVPPGGSLEQDIA